MSADKRKRFTRACALLLEINTTRYQPISLSGPKRWRRNRWSTGNPTIRYIVAKGMAKLVRVPRWPGYFDGRSVCHPLRKTLLDTGVPRAPRA